MLLGLSEKVGGRLRKSGKLARNVQIRLRYSDFSTITRQCTLLSPVDGDSVIYGEAKRMLGAALEERSGPVRLIGVGVAGLSDAAAGQLKLPEVSDTRDSKVSSTLDKIRDRFGDDAIKRGSATPVRRFVAPFVRQ
jgi:DNA polymerase-4